MRPQRTFWAATIALLAATGAALGALMWRDQEIHGRVVDAQTGQPLAGVEVGALWFVQRGDRRVSSGSVRSTETDISGVFVADWLRPGMYGLAFRLDDPNLPGHPRQARRVLADDVGYAPTYYPGVATVDEATSIALGPGRHVRNVQVRLTRVAKITVSGRVTRTDGTAVEQPARLQIYPRGERLMPAGQVVNLRADGTFEAKLVSGRYVLSVTLASKQADPPIEPRLAHGMWDEAFTRITVGDTPVTGVSLVAMRGSIFAGHVVFEGNSALPPEGINHFYPFRPSFRDDPEHPCRGGFYSALRRADMTFMMVNMRGVCEATIQPVMTPAWRIKSMRRRGVDLIGQRLDFDDGRDWRDVEVVLTDR